VLRDGPAEAMRWAEGLPDSEDEFKLNVFQRIAAAAAEVEPEMAAAFAARHLGAPYGQGLALRVGRSWGERDPEAALSWLSTLPPGRERNDGVNDTFMLWLRRDQQAAESWLRQAEPEPWLDPAVALYAKGLSLNDRERALDLALQIHDEELRWPTVVIIARVWLLEDDAAATSWIESAGMPEVYRQKSYAIPSGMRRAVGRWKEQEAGKELDADASADDL
jgi:hypothetical protein